jgi:cyclic pyranopterin phosphate synthase
MVTETAHEAKKDAQEGVGSQPILIDSFGRIARKLRIQVTDRCNYSCDFCMPPNPVWLDRSEVLTFEEMARISSVLSQMGVERIRLSGGEPLVRSGVEKLVGLLTRVPGIRSVSLTTNGSLLKEKARRLKENGLKGVTVSLHSLRPDRYGQTTGTRDMLPRVLDGIHEAMLVGLHPLKINCVVRRGENEDEIADFAKLAHDQEVSVRFIEYMPFNGKKFWEAESVLSGAEILEKVRAVHNLVPRSREAGATAETYQFGDGSKGEIGVITSMTKPFCGDCDRVRLTVDGKIVPCLFSRDEYDTKSLLRSGAMDNEIAGFIQKCFLLKSEGVESMIKQKVEFGLVRPMYTIGG